uniref:Uncharacterized protein n=1 Tax=Anguilla anguilla TaxID=7936 RepID=A0A0E9QNC8_ANGAN
MERSFVCHGEATIVYCTILYICIVASWC